MISRPLLRLLCSVAVALPLLLGARQWWPWVLVFAAASLVDVDHFLRFPSWWPVSAQDREHKRFLHSILIAVLAGLIVALAGGGWELGWMVAVGIISHLCRDATMGTVPLSFPARGAVKWGRQSYILAELLVTAMTFFGCAPDGPRTHLRQYTRLGSSSPHRDITQETITIRLQVEAP